MSLANIKLNNSASRGFTIVELLIVVVVIAILAAITIVSYNGITTRANASAAKSTASTMQKKIELYQAEVGSYPSTFANMQTGGSSKAYYLPTTAPLAAAGALDATNGKTTVSVQPCGTNAGVIISYYNYEGSGNSTINVGTTSPCAGTVWANP